MKKARYVIFGILVFAGIAGTMAYKYKSPSNQPPFTAQTLPSTALDYFCTDSDLRDDIAIAGAGVTWALPRGTRPDNLNNPRTVITPGTNGGTVIFYLQNVPTKQRGTYSIMPDKAVLASSYWSRLGIEPHSQVQRQGYMFYEAIIDSSAPFPGGGACIYSLHQNVKIATQPHQWQLTIAAFLNFITAQPLPTIFASPSLNNIRGTSWTAP